MRLVVAVEAYKDNMVSKRKKVTMKINIWLNKSI